MANKNQQSYQDVLSSSPINASSLSKRNVEVLGSSSGSPMPCGFGTALLPQRNMYPHGLISSPCIVISILMKLHYNNYLIWKEQMKSYMVVYDLESLIDESVHILSKFIGNT